MTDTTRTHVTFLIDRSGSMASQAEGVRKGFKDFVEEQRNVPGKCRLTVIQFDNHHGVTRARSLVQGGISAVQTNSVCEVLVDNVGINKVDPVGALELFQPRGGTPLYDATALAITKTDETIKAQTAKGKKPDHIIFVVFTDGMENASHEHSYTTLSELVKAKEAEGWTFVYLGANHDAYAQGGSTGFKGSNTQTYAGSDAGASVAYGSLSRSVTNHRLNSMAGVTNDAFFIDKDAEADLKGGVKEAVDKAVDKAAAK